MKTLKLFPNVKCHRLLPFLLLLCLSWSATILFSQDLEIVNIRVGQGDATLIQGPVDSTGNRVNVLFDAGDIGSRDGGNIIRTILRKHDVDHLDYLIVSHYDVDHIGGLAAGGIHGIGFLLGFDGVAGDPGDDDVDGSPDWILENINDKDYILPDPQEWGQGDDFTVGNFVDRGDESVSGTQAYEKYRFLAEASGSRISLTEQAAVETFSIDLGNGAEMIALAANGYVRERPTRVANVNTENERSLSFWVRYNDFDFLISGDLIGQQHGGENARVEVAVGEYISRQDIVLDVLHVNHHGANNSSEADFLELVQPTIAVISAGNGNSHRHPHRSALARLEAAGVYRIIQTSWGTTEAQMPEEVRAIQAIYQGDITIRSDGKKFTISTDRTFRTDRNPRRNE